MIATIAQQANREIQTLTVHVDVGDETSIVEGMQKVTETFGRIDIAVNNAGIGGPIMPSTDISVGAYRKVLEVNTIGLWISQREEIKHMLRQDLVEIR